MQRYCVISDFQNIEDKELSTYLSDKYMSLLQQYGQKDLSNIGCVVILDETEAGEFHSLEMEFTETLELKDSCYLHGVHIVSDYFAEDIYLRCR